MPVRHAKHLTQPRTNAFCITFTDAVCVYYSVSFSSQCSPKCMAESTAFEFKDKCVVFIYNVVGSCCISVALYNSFGSLLS